VRRALRIVFGLLIAAAIALDILFLMAATKSDDRMAWAEADFDALAAQRDGAPAVIASPNHRLNTGSER